MLAEALQMAAILFLSSSLLSAPATEEAVPEGLSARDWSSIRQAYDADRHAAHAVEGGHEAHNPGQRWRTRFDGRGFTTRPDAGGWTWGLELQRYGFAGGEREVTSPARVSAEGGRVVYAWDETLDEWYVNDARGLEHGYTVHRRPVRPAWHAWSAWPAWNGEGEGVALTFTLAVRGELRAEVTADGRGVRFLGGEGAVALTYTGLVVLDAEGRELEASFEQVGERLRLSIDERGARYPLTIDPTAQQAYLKASNAGFNDQFGYSVAVSGDTVVVGARRESSSATGVNGDQNDNSSSRSGAAYVFVRSGTIWSQQAYLKASNTDALDEFGWSVSVSGDTVVVGALLEDSDATGVDGDQNNSATDSGAAYVFVRSGTMWSQQAYLKASNTWLFDQFGRSVSVSGDTVVVGANRVGNGGAAYVFVRSGTMWSQQDYLTASHGGGEFGISVSVSGDTLGVGARFEDNTGSTYIFVRSGTSWSEQAYLKASNPGMEDGFGHSVSVSGDTAVVGALWEDSNATGVDGDQGNDLASSAGAAYVFVRSGTSWSQQAYLKASNTDAGDEFGRSVSVSDDTIVVGAREEDSNATGVNGGQSDNSAGASGAAYVFVRCGSTWSQLAYLKASNTDTGDYFGKSVWASSDMLVVGGHREDSSATSVNGDQSDNSVSNAGAVYVFDLDKIIGSPFCDASDGSLASCPCANPGDPDAGCDIPQTTGGVALAALAQCTNPNRATLRGTGFSTMGSPTATVIRSSLPNLVTPVVFGDGIRCLDDASGLVRLATTNAAGGVSTHTFGNSAMAGPGTKHYQIWFRSNPSTYCDPLAAFNLSNGRSLTW